MVRIPFQRSRFPFEIKNMFSWFIWIIKIHHHKTSSPEKLNVLQLKNVTYLKKIPLQYNYICSIYRKKCSIYSVSEIAFMHAQYISKSLINVANSENCCAYFKNSAVFSISKAAGDNFIGFQTCVIFNCCECFCIIKDFMDNFENDCLMVWSKI